MAPVVWMDDFLGLVIDPRYFVSTAGTGVVRISPGFNPGGVLQLYTWYGDTGTARIHFGEHPDQGPVSVFNWTATKNASMDARVNVSPATGITATVGFTGINDPDIVIAALIGLDSPNWIFQVRNVPETCVTNVDTGVPHTASVWTRILITTDWPTRTARLYINGSVAATVTGACVPPGGLVNEFQLWNALVNGAWTQTTMWVDYMKSTEDR